MDQNDTPTPDLSNPQEIVQPPPMDKQNGKTMKFVRARIFLFISLPILILVFSTNTIAVSIITTMLILLSIGQMFDPISNSILKYSDWLLIRLFKPFEWLWLFLFVKHLTSLGRWLKLHRRLVIDSIAIVTILTLLGATTLRPSFATWFGNLNDSVCLNTHLPWPTCHPGLGISPLPDGVRIGLITNNAYDTFDKSPLKEDEVNVEQHIFSQNQQACTGQHITLVVVVMLSRTVEDPLSSAKLGLQDLQGDYLAQYDYNKTHPAIRLCLAIANLGTADTAISTSKLVRTCPDCYAMPQVIHQIAQFTHTDGSIRGIVGFPFSQQAKEALGLIRGYQDLSTIPVISPSASSDELSNESNFYRMTAPDRSQGTTLAHFFCDNLRPTHTSDSIAMLTDPSNVFSRSLALAFNEAITCGDPTHRMTIPYTNGDTSSIQQAVDQALNQQHVAYIFFPGYDKDMDTIEQKVHEVLQDHARDITIIGGGGINNIDPTTHYSYTHIYATSSTGPLSVDDPIAKSFIQQGFSKTLFENAIQRYLLIPTDTLLAYDAVNVFVQIVKNWQGGDFTQDQLNKNLTSITFKGASDQITFQGTRNNGHMSDREQGYIYITCYDYAHNIHLITKYTTINAANGSIQNVSFSKEDGMSTCS